MLMNMVLAAWMIGSITLLIVKTDEQTGHYRDTLKTLDMYSQIHGFDAALNKRLRAQMKLYFSYRQLADEEVLKNFPTLTRRKVLKRLYLPCILDSSLMKGVRDQFIDAFLCCCRVEIFSPGEELLQRGANSTELYLLVEGDARLLNPIDDSDSEDSGGNLSNMDLSDNDTYYIKPIGPGQFINEVSFFTSTPMMETVQTTSICKALTLPMADFKIISEDHPGSVGQILQNLLEKMNDLSGSERMEYIPEKEAAKPTPPSTGMFTSRDTAGYGGHIPKPSDLVEDLVENKADRNGVVKQPAKSWRHSARMERQEIVEMHIMRLKDDQVGRLLFAASRGDLTTLSNMCDQGFDCNTSDYDDRTALMLAAAKGTSEVVKKLFEYHASPNEQDVNGYTALYEAVRNGHDSTMELIMARGGQLRLDEDKAVAEMNKAILSGHTTDLRRLLKAEINVNACGLDQRRAAHVAALTGDLEALKLLVEAGADVTVEDMWGVSVLDDAKKSKSEQVVQYLQSLNA